MSARADDRRQRETTRHRLAIGSNVRNDAVAFLGASPGNSETGHDFVEYEHYAMPGGYFAYCFEKARFRHEHAFERLDDYGGQLGGVVFDNLYRPVGFVKRGDQHFLADRSGYSFRVGQRSRIVAGHLGHGSPQRIVVHAVPAAFEFQNLSPARVGSRAAQRNVSRFCPRRLKPDLLPARNVLDQPLGESNCGFVE